MFRLKLDIWFIYKVFFFLSIIVFALFSSLRLEESKLNNISFQKDISERLSLASYNFLLSQESSMNLAINYINSDFVYGDVISDITKNPSMYSDGISNIHIINTNGDIDEDSVYFDFKNSILNNFIAESKNNIFSDYIGKILIDKNISKDSISLIMPFNYHDNNNLYLLVFVLNSSFNENVSISNLPRNSFLFNGVFSHNVDRFSLLKSESKIKITDHIKNRFDEIIGNSIPFKKSIFSNNSNFDFYYGSLNINNSEYYYSLSYDKNFNLWSISINSNVFMYKDFFDEITSVFLVFILSHLLVFLFCLTFSKNKINSSLKISHSKNHDFLTGLPNRYFSRSNYGSWAKNKNSVCAILIGIDRFKNINDVQGQVFADKVLIEVSNRLKSISIGDSLLSRENGDEFLILTDISNVHLIESTVKKILSLVSDPYNFLGVNFISVSCSIGISIKSGPGVKIEDLIRCSSIAMYEAKKEKGVSVFFRDEMISDYMERARIENRLRIALSLKNISISYQPQVNPDGSLYGVEALVRWHDEVLGYVSPDVFIPIAEDSGLIHELGKYIKLSAMKDMRKIQENYGISFRTSINISVKQINGSDFIKNILDAANETSYPLDLLTVEITESVFASNLEDINFKLNKLRSLGVKVSLDDFGTGYSSLSMLNRVSIDELKIDKSFIDNISTNDRANRMVQSIITIGKNFETIIVAEGIESDIHHKELVGMGCDLFQGYYFSEPLCFNDLNGYCKNKLS